MAIGSTEQKRVVVGMSAGIATSAAIFYLAHEKLPLVPVIMEPLERVGYAVRLLPIPALALAAGIAGITIRRFFSEDAIGGDSPAGDRGLDIDRRYVQNTAEQLALAVPVQLAFAYCVPGVSFKLVPVAAVWFLLARIAFWVGYHRAPAARSFGFVSTFFPTLGLLAYCFYRMASGN